MIALLEIFKSTGLLFHHTISVITLKEADFLMGVALMGESVLHINVHV